MFFATLRRGRSRSRFTPFVEELEARDVPALLGQTLFPADNPWNQPIATAPVAANSTAILNNIISRYGDGALHPDFSQNFRDGRDLYGIPFNIVHGNSTPKVSVVIDAYADESDLIPAPLTGNLVLEGDFQNGPRIGVDNRGDSHLLVWDVDNNIAYEFYRASRPSENADGRWHADQQTVWDMKTNTFRTLGWTSADAAGLSILAGLVRPDEALPVSQGGQGVINHAIRFTLRNDIILDQFLYPASHVANPGNNNPAIMPPMGARFRLKADVDISQMNPQSRIIAQAMKDYGMILADNGSNFFFSGASSSVDASNNLTFTWNDNDVQDRTHGLKSLNFSDFEVVDLTPIITGLSTTSGPAGTSVTIVGQNFSGAAGQLKVLFGSTASTSFTIVDDRHVIAVAPPGTGTVDVRIQSGRSTVANGDNIKSTIFGYGISAVNTSARFTYSTSGGNQAPTVATAASASPGAVVGSPTALSVLGADDAGEANLSYTWTSTGPAPVNYTVNSTNAAKTTSVSFTQAGSYTFVVAIRDAGGLTVSSSVAVNVAPPPNQAPTVQSPATANPAVVNGTSTALSVLGADDGGEANLTYTWTSSGPAGVAFSVNGANSAKSTAAVFSTSGQYTLTVTIRDAGGLTVTSTVAVSVTIPVANKPPTVKSAAKASPATVTGTSTSLSVRGADDGGVANLTYTWATRIRPAGAPAPTFSVNGTNAAQNTTVTFYQAGVYIFDVVIRDAHGLTATSSVTVTVKQKASSIKLTPSTTTLSLGQTVQFQASAFDQFQRPMATQPVFYWRLQGRGRLTPNGLYMAPRTTGGSALVSVHTKGLSVSAMVAVITTL